MTDSVQPWTHAHVTADGRQFAYHRTGGDLPPLVLCHGITDNGLCWSRVAKALEGDFDIIMLDARGHGDSDKSAPTPTSHVEDLAGAIAALQLRSPALMGHSMGARTVAGFAATHPGICSRIVLEDPPWHEPPADDQGASEATEANNSTEATKARAEGFSKMIAAFKAMTAEEGLTRGRRFFPTWHPDEFPAWVESNRQVADNVTQAFVSEPWRSVASQLTCPTLLIAGDTDRGGIVSEALLKEAERLNDHIATVRLAGAGHNIRRECFDEFVELVRGFLLN